MLIIVYFCTSLLSPNYSNMRIVQLRCRDHSFDDSIYTEVDNENEINVTTNGRSLPQKSWFFVHHSTIKGNEIGCNIAICIISNCNILSFSEAICDLLLVYNVTICMLGFVSNRVPDEGSIFIQALCKELDENGSKHDINTIASCVNRRIMNEYSIQAPIFENQLGDFVYLAPDDQD